MFCIKCGSDNLEKAKFCRECGEAFEHEEETRVVGRALEQRPVDEDPAESELFAISPTLLFVKIGYVLAAVGALLLAALTSMFFWAVIPVWISVLIGLMLFLIPAYYHFMQKMIRYRLTESTLELDEGFISRTTRSVPLRRIQDVTVSANALQRILGFGNLTIDNASDDAEKIVLANINHPRRHADILLRQMRRLEG